MVKTSNYIINPEQKNSFQLPTNKKLAGNDANVEMPMVRERSCGNTYADTEIKLPNGEWTHQTKYVPEYQCPLSPGSPKSECCEELLPFCCREPRFWEVQALLVAIFYSCEEFVKADF